MKYEEATPKTRVCHPKHGTGIVAHQDYYSRVKVDVIFDAPHPNGPQFANVERINVAELAAAD